MKKAFCNEFYKGRHAYVWAIPLAFICITILWQIFCNQNLKSEELAYGYTYLLYQFPVMNSLMMPLMIAVLASRLCDMEIKGDTIKQLYTLQSRKAFYDSKFFHEAFFLLLFVIGECAIICLCGTIYHYTDNLNMIAFGQFGAVTFVVGLVILMLQHFLSLTFTNQIIPLIIGLAGSFLGLFAMFLPHTVSRWIIYSYFAEFQTAKMSWDSNTREIWFTPLSFPHLKFVLLIILGVALFIISQKIFAKKEV